MGKGIIISLLFMLVMLTGAVNAQSASQQVTVTVVSGFLNVYSPVDKVYQENKIPLSVEITTPYEVTGLWMTDGRENLYLCSKCKIYNKDTFFKSGKHEITITARLSNGDSLEKGVSFQVDSGSSVYIQTSSGLRKASAKNIVDYLFHYNFTLELKNEMAPEDSCSVRARNGNSTLNGNGFGNNNKLNFYSIQSIEQGQIELSMQNKRKTVSYKFKVASTLENSDSLLKMSLIDRKNNEAILEFDKLGKKASIYGNNFSVQDMEAYFVSGCSASKESFWLLKKENGRINRNIEDVRQILTDNPILISRFESLKFLFTSNWKLKQILGFY